MLCDINALDTLPRNDLLAGMAEVVKIGFVRDTSILDDVERDPFGSTDTVGDLLPDLIRRAVQVKADVVGQDFREIVGHERRRDASAGRCSTTATPSATPSSGASATAGATARPCPSG